jgi:hypothetical protein
LLEGQLRQTLPVYLHHSRDSLGDEHSSVTQVPWTLPHM